MTSTSVKTDLPLLHHLPSLGWIADRGLLTDEVLGVYLSLIKENNEDNNLKDSLLGRAVLRGLSKHVLYSFLDEYKDYISVLDVSGCQGIDLSSLPLHRDQITTLYCGNFGLKSIMEVVSLVEQWPKVVSIRFQPTSTYIPGTPNILPSSLTRLSPIDAVQYVREFGSASDPLTEVRLVMLGHGTAGKTTLKLSLREEESETSVKNVGAPRKCRVLATEDRTNGVDVNEVWSIEPYSNEGTWPHKSLPPSVRILDFPGQSEFYSSNRLLLSSLELTICLVTARLVPIDFDSKVARKTSIREAMDDQWKLNEAQLSFWLTMLDDMSRYEATESGNLDSRKPVYVVFTCLDLASPSYALELKDEWMKRNKDRYTHLDLCGVSCVAGREIDSEAVSSLRSSLVETSLEMMKGEAVPRSILGAKYILQEKWRHLRLLPTSSFLQMIHDFLKTDRRDVTNLIFKSLQVSGLILPVDSVGVTVVDPFWLSLVVNKVVCPIELGGISCEENDENQVAHVVTRSALHRELNQLVSMLHHLLAISDSLIEDELSEISIEESLQICLAHPSSSPNTFHICFEGEVKRLSKGFFGHFRKFKSIYLVVVSPGYLFIFDKKSKWEHFRDKLASGSTPRSTLSLLCGRGVYRISSHSLNISHIDDDIHDISLSELNNEIISIRVKLSPIVRDPLRAGMAHSMPISDIVEEEKEKQRGGSDFSHRDHNSVDVICEVLQSLDVMFLLSRGSESGNERGVESTCDPSSDRFLIPSRLVEDAPVGQTWKDQLRQYHTSTIHEGEEGAVVNVIRFSSARKDPFPPALIGRIVFALYEMPSIRKQQNFLTAYRGEVRVTTSSGTEIFFRFAPNDCLFDVALVCTSREVSEVDVPLVLQALVELLDGRCIEVSNVRLPFIAEELCLHCLLSIDLSVSKGGQEHSQSIELHSREEVELLACRSSFFCGCNGTVPHELKRLWKELSMREVEVQKRQATRLQGWSEWSSSSDGGSVLRLIPMQEVDDIRCVNDGNFGVVFEGRYKGKHVAIKAPKRHVQGDEQWREFSLWSSLPRHANICPLLGFCESFAFDTPSDTALENDPSLKPVAYRSLTSKWKKSGRRRQSFIEKSKRNGDDDGGKDWTRVQAHDSMMLPFVGPSLLNIAHTSKNRSPLDEDTALRYLMDVARGLVVLHDKGIVHRDIALRNILIFEDGHRACLTDFGLSAKGKPRKKKKESQRERDEEVKETEHNSPNFSVKMRKGLFPVKLFAPEVFLTMEYGPEADVYMFGWMVANMLQRGSEPEWRDVNKGEYYEVVVGGRSFKEKLKNGEIYLDMNIALEGMNEEWKMKLQPLIEACTMKEPSERYTMKDVYKWLEQHRASVLGVSVEELENQIISLTERERKKI